MEQIDNQWLRALTAHAPEMVIQLAARLTESWQVSYEAVPQTGLSLLQLQDSVLHEPYYLGEIPLSTAWVKLKIGNGHRDWRRRVAGSRGPWTTPTPKEVLQKAPKPKTPRATSNPH